MPPLDPQTVADKWVQRAGAASADYQRGVEQTDKDPTALAAAAGARYIAKVQEAYNSGKWARRLQAVGKAGWTQAVVSKGVANYTTGVNSARDKYATAIGPVLQAVAAGQRIVAGMPNVTEGQRDARMLAFINHMRQFGANR
jgi:hypothetical protein